MDFCGKVPYNFLDYGALDLGDCWRDFILTSILLACILPLGLLKLFRLYHRRKLKLRDSHRISKLIILTFILSNVFIQSQYSKLRFYYIENIRLFIILLTIF